MFFPSFSAKHIDRKLQISNLELFAMSPGKPPYKIAVYIPGTKVFGIVVYVGLYAVEPPIVDTPNKGHSKYKRALQIKDILNKWHSK